VRLEVFVRDLHLWEGEGDYTGTAGSFMKVEDRGVRFPITLGHEVAGTVEETGDAITILQKGDQVLVYLWVGEGLCSACRAGEEHLCDSPRTLGNYQDGGYWGPGLMAVQLAKAITKSRLVIVDINDNKL
jgi:alcohol dehydrogenase, propanol-preferring